MIYIGKRFRGESVAVVTIPDESGGFLGRGEGTVNGFRLGAELRGGVGRVWRGRVGGGKVDLGLAALEG